MDAETECRMPVDLAINEHLIGIVEELRVAVRGREAEQDPVVLLHRATFELEVFLDQPGHGDRGVGPQELLDGRGDELRVSDEAGEILRVVGEMPQRGSDGGPGGVDAGHDEQDDGAEDMLVEQLVAGDLGIEQVGDQVIGRVLAMVLDELDDVGLDGSEAGHALGHGQVDRFDDFVHE
ncbi:unannotated protein [freshwater metagenome]|uniref:Unannotated protein n=1 Tax=freshwater metagenome TaxID=449393 RepID=A0A6J5Y9H6_9ZZZZ